MMFLIKAYSTLLSPVLGNNCRYYPSCSAYMSEAIDKYGAARGTWMGLKRLSRCHPFHEGGFDPVPDNAPKDAGKSLKDRHNCSHKHH